MAKYRLSADARLDLLTSLRYVAERSSIETAHRLGQLIEQRFRLLAEHPLIGRPRSDLGDGLRSFPASSYIILYRQFEDGIEVVRVVHGRRDLESLFGR